MRLTLMLSVLVVSACSGGEDVNGASQAVADPAPLFSIQSASFSNALNGDPTTMEYCGSAPQTACASTPFTQIRWGTPADPEAGKSGLGFDPAASHVVVYDAAFDFGTLTHFNFPTYSGTGATDVTLDLHLRIDPSVAGPALFDQDIHIPFAIDET